MLRQLVERRTVSAWPQRIVLAIILLTAATLRLYQLDWDEGTLLHPDELHVINTITLKIVVDWPPDFDNLLDPTSSRLNPRSEDPLTGNRYNFAYGAMPLIVVDLVASLLSKLTGTDWSAFYGHIHKVGRALTALVDTLTVLVVFLLGRRAFNAASGLAAAALYAAAPMSIQLAHFFTTDSWMTLFATLTLLSLVRASESDALRWYAVAGAMFGLAMAAKPGVPVLAVVFLVPLAFDLQRRLADGEPFSYAISAAPERVALAIAGAFAAFAVFEPYALADPLVYLSQLNEQARIVRGTLDVPFTRQYVGTTPVVYQLDQLLRWGLGPVSGLLCLGGAVVLARRAARFRDAPASVLIVWLVIEGIVVLTPETKFVRYLAPLLPVLAVGGGALLIAAAVWLRRRAGRAVAYGAVALVVAGVALSTASFMNVYAATNPRVAASQWIYANIPNGSRLSAETWDLALPISLAPGLTSSDRQYETIDLDLYTTRSPNIVADDIYQVIGSADYIVMSSTRAQTAMPRSPWRYPAQTRYYELLRSGSLGFTLVKTFKVTPGFGPFSFDDSSADESLINYDHPTVSIYQKTASIDRATFNGLMAPAESQPYSPTRNQQDKSLMLDQPVWELPVVNDARWSEALTGKTLPALIVWLALLAAMQLIALPIVAKLFPRFPDLGAGFGRLVVLLLMGYVVWITASLQVLSFRAIWCAAVFAVAAAWSGRLWLQPRLRAKIAQRKRTIFGAELVFWVVFALFLIYRFVNPDSWHPAWGGEKPMEFAQLNSILRSANFPPVDAWYAGGYLNYYYYGSYLTAFLFKLTGIPSEIAFNLAQPTMIALIASAGYSVAAAVARDVTRTRRAAIGGFLGAGLLVLAGNLDSFVLFVRALPNGVDPTFETWTWPGSRAITGGITEFPYFTGLYADLHAHVVAWSITVLAIGLCYSIAQQPRLLAVAVSQSRRRGTALRAIGARFGMLALVLGSLFATNAWDVPVYAALTAIAIFMATGALPHLSVRIALTGLFTLAIGGVAYLLFLPFFNHYTALYSSLERTRTQTDLSELGLHLGVFLPIIAIGLFVAAVNRGVAGRAVGWLDPLIVVGLAGGLVLVDAFGVIDAGWIPGAVAIVGLLAPFAAAVNQATVAPSQLLRTPAIAVAVIGGAGSFGLVIAGRETLGVAVGFASAGAVCWLIGDSIGLRFTGAMIAAGASIVGGVDLIFLVDDLAPDPVFYRMNTVFKFYNQVWTLLALAAAVLLTMMGQRFFASNANQVEHESEATTESAPFAETDTPVAPTPTAPRESVADLVRRRWVQVGVVGSGLLICASLFYPLFSTLPRLEQRFPGHPGIGTLNALDWMRYGTIQRPDRNGEIAFADDLAAIEWLNDNVSGTPVIVEASIGPYRGNGSRISIATGLPAVIGWERHERQQRYPAGIAERYRDVRTLYNSADPAEKLSILQKYNVEYVILGDVERYSAVGQQWYASAEGIAAFDQLVGVNLEVAFQSGTTTIYRVLPSTSDVIE